ncbi:unnamed protein product [Caenorhabditis angaria]|uniref:Uncharacterized protein n=1 Tax=Caenorhabditis angaria TaxID=860376 RepID=A0A9P1MWJ9_9PELO|nr:unnamed protein product [Caenorhabditis angaria]
MSTVLYRERNRAKSKNLTGKFIEERKRKRDNEGGVGHDVLEQIMRDAAQADDIQNREIDAILDEEQDSPQAALLQ